MATINQQHETEQQNAKKQQRDNNQLTLKKRQPQNNNTKGHKQNKWQKATIKQHRKTQIDTNKTKQNKT